MKISTVTIVLILFITISHMASCSKEDEKASEGSYTIERYVPEPKPPELKPGDFTELKFIPPEIDEEIVVDEEGLSDPKTNKILIYKKSKDKKELLFTIKPETNYFYVMENKGDIYFTIEDDNLSNGLNDLWKIVINEGIIKNTKIKIGDVFAFSLDGIYICYVYNDYPSYDDHYGWAFIPIVKTLNLITGEETKYDFSNSFLEGEWGSVVDILPAPDRIRIRFSMEGGTLGKGYILLSDKKFYQTK